ncbi:hypothetical protein POPTR_009G086850v4 [Populus trichocarpa]|uniref:Uncharacterized protein n=3 Tax=Populus trichocarpa TaxID=3694 RepID=A0ACC0SH94_POPTR|nr:hypothetical protein BDE02_09G075700 [Populus trichocarpa]KAI5576883.1 hypothetical protein BDE02_09G075700 [Populus trichocarpa]KAI5576884.1 hypothetical protein BDE02_09G075700 [Populus trichocarpa]KAI9388598.1 hypothetical protein POPTR_009G086850v4 [Populus trichocarpa]KAI9388599.1 hypothetical protein POPTR_009G086850v4 [Populus trichocarpa]
MGAGAEDRRHFQITGSGTEGSEGVRDFLLKRPAVLMMNRAGSFFSDCTVQFS